MEVSVSEPLVDSVGRFQTESDVSGRVDDLEGKRRRLPHFHQVVEFAINRFVFGGPFSCLHLPIEISNPVKVAKYIVENPVANEAVEQTYAEITDYFPDSGYRLEVQNQYGDNGDTKLALFVSTDSEPEAALSALDSFDEEFWLDHMSQYDTHLQVHLEYR